MSKKIPQEILEAFTTYEPDLPSHAAGVITVETIGHGLINHSWKVKCELKPDFFLQQINTDVFERPQDVQQNYIHLWQYAEFEFTGLRMPAPIHCSRERTLYKDEKGNYWRAFEWIGGGRTLATADTASRARATARAFAKFTAAFEDMNTALLREVIPGFHDLGLRYRQFEEALQTGLYERMARSVQLIDKLKQRERYRHFYEVITESAEFPKRVMHHDAKISNILFHEKTGKVICPVDYDTVMPGYFFSDLGDMIRSMVCKEDENNPGAPQVRKDFYEAIISGYTDVLGAVLTVSERTYIHAAGLLMTYMQALRFLTDYLQGDLYYKTSYPEQNLDRALNQFSLLKGLEEFLLKEHNFKI